jgi:Mor family transcriptional regulator
MNGIYCYIDNKTNKIVYVGKDSNIDNNRRHKDHLLKCNRNRQVINRILQNNPKRYTYNVLKQGKFKDNLLNALEIIYIRRHNPKFNYTIGGDYSPNIRLDINSTEIKEDYLNGIKLKELPLKYNCSLVTVQRRIGGKAIDLKLPSDEQLYEEHKQGLTYMELAEKYNVGYGTIHRHIQKITGKPKYTHKKYSEFDKQILKEYVESDMTYNDLAEKYGVDYNTIHSSIRRARRNKGVIP